MNSKMIHILYIYPELTIKGGADKVIVEKANYLVRDGYKVTIVTEAQMGRNLSFNLDSKVKHIDMGLDFNRQYNQGFIRRAYTYLTLMRCYRSQMAEVLKEEKPDIVITALGRSIDFITSMKDGSVKMGEAHTIKAHLRSFYLLKNRGFFYRKVAKLMEKRTCKLISRLDALVLLTQQDANDWTEVHHTFVIPNAVPYYPENNAELRNKHVIMVGRYNDAKGYEYMISAWELVHKAHPEWVLDIFGSGELHDSVSEWIVSKHLEDSMIMHEPTDDIMNKYMESSICVLSSRYEGFPMVLLEAMACGVPCVSFDCPHGPRNIIRNEEDGLLVEYLNPPALADGICRLIEDEELRRRLGENARRNILRFSKDMIMKQWENLFQSLLK